MRVTKTSSSMLRGILRIGWSLITGALVGTEKRDCGSGMPRLLRCAFRSPQSGFRPPVLHPLFRAGGGEQGEKREAAKHDGRSKNQERLAPVHVVLTTSVDLNPLGPVPFFLDSPPDLLHDSTGSFRRLCRFCFHWRRFLLCTAMSAHARGPGGIVLLPDLSLWSLIANTVIGRHRSPLGNC